MHIEQIFGPPGERQCLVVAGACGNVGYGKLGQFARLLARHGVPVVGLDLMEQVAQVPERLREELGRKFDAATVDAVLAGVRCIRGGIDAVGAPIGMVFEAIPEKLGLKRSFYREARAAAPEALLFSATSGFTTRKLFEGLPSPDRCGVLHPFFPHLTNKLFELPVDGVTGAETREAIAGLLRALGLVPLEVRDVPSFAADRVFCMMMTEALRVHVDLGLPAAAIDGALQDALGARPFLVHDMIVGANRLTVSCIDELAGESDSSFYTVPPLFRDYAADPSLRWDARARVEPLAPEQRQEVADRVIGALLAITSRILDQRICGARELNLMCEQALAFRKGVPALARQLGLQRARELVERYLEEQSVTHAEEVAAPAVFDDAACFDGLYVTTRDEGDCLVVELGRPAINGVYVEEFAAALDRLEREPFRCAVLVHDGVANQEFGRGADVTEFLPALGDEPAARELSARWKRVFARLRAGKPVVAALARRSLGGSNEIAALCHARVAAAGTTIGQPEPVVGVIPGLGGCTTLLRAAHPERRTEVVRLLLTGDPVDAEEALRLGLVSAVVPGRELTDRAIALAREIAGGKHVPFEEGPFELALPDDVPQVNAAGVRLDSAHRAILAETIAGCAARDFASAMEYETEQSGKAFTLSAARIGVHALLRGKQPEFES